MERIDRWPRVHTCLYDWCPHKHEECERCDGVTAIMRGDKQCDHHVARYYYEKRMAMIAPDNRL